VRVANAPIEDPRCKRGRGGGFHLFKHDFLKGKLLYDAKACDKKLNQFMDHYLNRYFGELHGLTPQQVLNGEIPNKHKFTPQIQQAKKDRLAANKAFSGWLCSIANKTRLMWLKNKF
jgi:hypothetical protein